MLCYMTATQTLVNSMIGFYHAQMATRTNELDPDTVENHYRQAGLAYLEAARMFLPDDEQRVCKSYT